MAPSLLFRTPSPLQTFDDEPQYKIAPVRFTTIALPAKFSLDDVVAALRADNPFAGFTCIYCRPGCPGGSISRCHKVATNTATTPSSAHAFAELLRAEYTESGKVQAGYHSYLRVLNHHVPYTSGLMAAENEKARLAIKQVERLTLRLADLTTVAELIMASGATFVPESVWQEAEVARGWLEHLFGKLVKNHECLKLNFMNDHTLLL